MKIFNIKDQYINQVQEESSIEDDDDEITTTPAEREESDILHHFQATVTVADLELVSSPPHHSTAQNATKTNSDHDATTATITRTVNQDSNNIDGNDNKSICHVDGLKKLLTEKLSEDQGHILIQLLLAQEYQKQLQEKEYQHQLRLELVTKEKNYQLLMERKNHEMELVRKDFEMKLERKDHEMALVLEKKDAEIAKQQLELKSLKVRLSLENNAATANDNLSNCTMTFDSETEEIQEQLEEINLLTTNTHQNCMEQMEKEMDDNNNAISETSIDNSSLIKKKLMKLNQEMDLIKRMFVPEPVTFKSDKNSWQTYVPSSWSPMTSGKHKWTIKFSPLFLGGSFASYVGLITVSDHLQYNQQYRSKYLCDIPSWSYNSSGSIYHDSTKQWRKLPKFSRGDSISFVLDLGTNDHKDENTNGGDDTSNNDGSWYVRVHGQEEQLVFSNLSSIAKSMGGFFPAVSVEGYHHVCFEYNFEDILEE